MKAVAQSCQLHPMFADGTTPPVTGWGTFINNELAPRYKDAQTLEGCGNPNLSLMNCWCPHLCSLSSLMCRELNNLGMQRGSGKKSHKYRSTTAWFKGLPSFSLSSYICSLFPQYSVKPPSWSLIQVLKVQAMLTFYDAVKAISPSTGTSVDTELAWCYLETFHNQLQWEGLTISPDSALTWKDEREHGVQEWASCIHPKMST